MCNEDCFNCIYPDCVREEFTNAKNKEKRYQRTLEWRRNNPEKARQNNRRACAKYYQSHKQERLEYFKERYKKKKEEARSNRV